MRKYLVFFVLGMGAVASVSSAYADSWNLPGVSIVTREQWGADESLKYGKHEQYQEIIRIAQERDKYMTDLQREKAEEEAEKAAVARAHALANFPNDILLDMVVDKENGNNLWWDKEYKFNKTKILIHHTVNDITKFSSEDSVKTLLRSVYRMHAFTNGWGDIGYNFVISPNGVIYEGRDGGEGVVGAHATWNNQPSIGIALIGNFQVDKPTDAQISALVRLSTALAAKYNIDPMSSVDYHKKTSVSPYVTTFSNFAVASHRDVGPTACPGENLYALVPAIRDSIKANIPSYLSTNPGVKTIVKPTVSSTTTPQTAPTKPAVSTTTTTKPSIPTTTTPTVTKTTLSLNPALQIISDIYLIRTRTSQMGTSLPKCQILQGEVNLAGCMYRNGELIVGVKKKFGNMNPGTVRIKAASRTSEVTFDIQLAWVDNSTGRPPLPSSTTQPVSAMPTVIVPMSLLEQRRANFPLSSVKAITKITTPVSASVAPMLMKNDVSVLLHNASMLSSSWTFVCTGTCTMSESAFTSLTVVSSGGVLSVQKNGLVRKESQMTMKSSEGSTITVLDSVSKKQYGIYRGSISVQKQLIKKIDGNYSDQYTIINTLPLSQYLAGIAEASDKEPIEKTKVLALLSKAYALYYVGGSGPHPSIPKGAAYQAIDDPRFFQKYNGVTWERTSKNWPIAMEATKDLYVTYNDILPILPYFHCSPGFTWSGREKWGWTDTPYLQSVLDESGCTTFEGHGVGLSGQGATKKAQNGEKAEDILKYYYKGVEVKSIY